MKQDFRQKMADVFNRNLDSKITMELANGMLQSIFAIVENELSEQEQKQKQEE